MRAVVLAVLLGSGVFSWMAFAETEATTAPAVVESQGSTGLKLKNAIGLKKFEEDKRITDLELKAQGGSLSRYSLKFSLNYDGPAVNELDDADRPNPDNRSGDYRTNLSGNMGLRYRINKATALSFGTGMRWFTPYQAAIGQEVERPRGAKNYDISDPGVGIDRLYLLSGVQARSSLSYSMVTNDYYEQRGQIATINYGQSLKWVVAQSRVTLGAQISANYFAFARDYQPKVGNGKAIPGDGKVSKYMFTLIPSLEYKILDNLNFNTSMGYPYNNLRSEPSWWNWTHQLSTVRVGMGWAIRRDIYFNPFVNFFAESPAINTASLNFNTVFSIF